MLKHWFVEVGMSRATWGNFLILPRHCMSTRQLLGVRWSKGKGNKTVTVIVAMSVNTQPRFSHAMQPTHTPAVLGGPKSHQ